MATDFSQGLAARLDNVCQELTPGLLVEEELSPLREIERFLWKWEDVPDKNDDLAVIYYSLDTFLDNFFYNFSPEIPPAESIESIYQTFIDKLKEAFGELAQCLRDARYADFYPSYKKMALVYLATVDALNRTLK